MRRTVKPFDATFYDTITEKPSEKNRPFFFSFGVLYPCYCKFETDTSLTVNIYGPNGASLNICIYLYIFYCLSLYFLYPSSKKLPCGDDDDDDVATTAGPQQDGGGEISCPNVTVFRSVNFVFSDNVSTIGTMPKGPTYCLKNRAKHTVSGIRRRRSRERCVKNV